MSIFRQFPWCRPPWESFQLYQQSIRGFRLKAPGNRSHYDSLGVTPSATQDEIKSSYYKLSKLYHPDRNKGSEEAANHFKTINEAYEILGNFKKRRMYDKGVSFGASTTSEADEKEDAQTRFYRSRGSAPTGKTPIYDFDEWARNHYGESFKRREAAKERHARKVKNVFSHSGDRQQELTLCIGLFIVLFSCYLSLKINHRYDEDYVSNKKKKS